MRRKRHEKAACNIAPVISECNQLQYESGWKGSAIRESAKDILLFGSADLAASLIPHGLIDEFRVALNPIILGGGTPLFKQGERVKLKLLDTRALSTGIVILRYAPAT
jgi:dihydrofolate reductase